jgi:hypothetical protein
VVKFRCDYHETIRGLHDLCHPFEWRWNVFALLVVEVRLLHERHEIAILCGPWVQQRDVVPSSIFKLSDHVFAGVVGRRRRREEGERKTKKMIQITVKNKER